MPISDLNNDFIPYGRHNITESDINSVIKVLKSDYLTQGPLVEKLEQQFCKTLDVKYTAAVNSATSALHLACLSLGLGKNDVLWTTSTTFVASANCGRYCGAKIDFVDIDIKTGLISIEKLKIKLETTKKNNLPKILVVVHLAGTSCDMKGINNLAKKYNFKVIEDASHAIGGKYLNEPIGNCRYSSITVFSFHPVKIITSGEGGLTTTNNNDIAEKIKDLRSHGITKDKTRFLQINPPLWSYEQQNLGFNYRMNDIEAALAISQLKRLKEIVERRNFLLDIYKKELKHKDIDFLEIPKECYSSVHLAIIQLKSRTPENHRKIFDNLRSNKIGVQLHYEPVHLQPYYRKLGFTNGYLPESEQYAKCAISIPLFPTLKEKEQDRVINEIKKELNSI